MFYIYILAFLKHCQFYVKTKVLTKETVRKLPNFTNFDNSIKILWSVCIRSVIVYTR